MISPSLSLSRGLGLFSMLSRPTSQPSLHPLHSHNTYQARRIYHSIIIIVRWVDWKHVYVGRSTGRQATGSAPPVPVPRTTNIYLYMYTGSVCYAGSQGSGITDDSTSHRSPLSRPANTHLHKTQDPVWIFFPNFFVGEMMF